MPITENALTLLKKGYLREGESTWEDIARRVSYAIADAEENPGDKTEWNHRFSEAIINMDFIPSTPCLVNAGTQHQQLSSCFIIDLRDNIESIYEAKSEMAKIFQKNGGAGLNISVLRPTNTTVETSGGLSCGTIGFMEEFDLTADVVTRNNLRKGALKVDLCDWHPDLIDFIKCKDDTTKLTRMNISVAVSDEFMKAVENDTDWNLEFPDYSIDKDMYNEEWDGDLNRWKQNGWPVKVYQTLKARDIYRLIMEHAWKTGEPGIAFSDNCNKGNPNPQLGRVYRSNPCMEFVSIPYNSCNLGSINLSQMVKDNDVDYEKLKYIVCLGVRFLDDMISVNQLPLEKIDRLTKSIRSVGLGTMGLADMMYRLGIPYGSDEAVQFVDDLYAKIKSMAQNASTELSNERGCYDRWVGSIWEQRETKIRNSNLLSIAPNGSIGIIANTSGGLEPNFALAYSRRMNDGTLFNMLNPVLEEKLGELGILSEELVQKIIDNGGGCQGITEIPKEIQKVFVVASDLTPDEHLNVLATIQEHVDLSCSKTINMPNKAKVEDIEDIYIKAWGKGVKGVSIYRDGSRSDQTLSVKRDGGNEHSVHDKSKYDYIEPITKDELGDTIGTNVKRKTACGSLYISACKNSDGALVEMFINTGKGGICQSSTNAISRLVSTSLRGGVRVEEICDQLKGIQCPACVRALAKGEKLYGVSCPDVIGKVLLEEYNKDEVIVKKTKKKTNSKKKTSKQEALKSSGSNGCPECGNELIAEGGCNLCKSCGYSKCG